MIGHGLDGLIRVNKKKNIFTHSSQMPPIKNPTKTPTKKIQFQFQKPSKQTQTYFHKFSMNPTTKKYPSIVLVLEKYLNIMI
jgi:hypothetical protein